MVEDDRNDELMRRIERRGPENTQAGRRLYTQEREARNLEVDKGEHVDLGLGRRKFGRSEFE